MSQKEKVLIFDTTLRDGEQSPGASLNVQEKIEIARQLEKLNVDVIEAGFPASSPLQLEAVRRVGEESSRIVAALARAVEHGYQHSVESASKRSTSSYPYVYQYIGYPYHGQVWP